MCSIRDLRIIVLSVVSVLVLLQLSVFLRSNVFNDYNGSHCETQSYHEFLAKFTELQEKIDQVLVPATPSPSNLPPTIDSLPPSNNDPLPPKNDSVPSVASIKEIPLSEWKTSQRCFFFSDFTQMCIYDQLCTDGKNLVFLDPSQKNNRPMKLSGPETGSRMDQRYYEPTFPVVSGKFAPAGSTMRHNIVSIPSSQLGKERNVELLPGTIWYAPFDGSAGNLWHFGAQNMLMWEAQIYNETLPEGAKLPSIDYIHSPRDFIAPGWQAEMIENIVQPHTQFLFPQFYLTEDEFVRQSVVWYTIRDETKFNHNLPILLRPPGTSSIGMNNLVCSEKAVVFSQKPRLFSGTYSAHRFKEKVGKYLGFPTQKPRGNAVSNKVVIDYRGEGKSRNLFNRPEILELLAYYNLTVVDMRSFAPLTSLSDQILDLWDADVYIIVHGAGVTNAMFLPYRASLIEIYPWGYSPPMYHYMADAAGLHYFGIQSYIKGPIWEGLTCATGIYTPTYRKECHNLSNIEQISNSCGTYTKNCCVVVPIRDLEMALLQSYDFIGVNLNTRVEKLFYQTREFRENDWHHVNNTLWSDT